MATRLSRDTPNYVKRVFLTGHAGTGKTTQLTARLRELVASGVRPDRILCLVPQQSAADRLRAALSTVRGNTRGEPTITTLPALAQQHVGLLFPLIAERAGFAEPAREPMFINVESAQYFLNAQLETQFAQLKTDLNIYRPRIVSQLLDNLNKAATSGFPLEDIADRLSSAWNGVSTRKDSYRAAQETAVAFRAFCLEHSLLDFSLTMTLFASQLMREEAYRGYARARYRHVLADNIEEGVPPLHDLLELVLESCESALVVSDAPGGYRLFLGADPQSAARLQALCDSVEETTDPRLEGATPAAFGERLGGVLLTNTAPSHAQPAGAQNALEVLPATKYWASMVQGVADRITTLVGEGVAPNEIAVIAPFVEDVLRFELSERLTQSGITVSTLRPSRPLFDHPVVRATIALAKCAHPGWGLLPASGELARALSICIADLDLVRAQLLSDQILRLSLRGGLPVVDDQNTWLRVGMRFRDAYARLQEWIAQWPARAMEGQPVVPLDIFWQRAFTDLLSTRGFGLNSDLEGADVMARLIHSARMFREVFEARGLQPHAARWGELLAFVPGDRAERVATADIGLAYVSMLSEGMLAAQRRVGDDSGEGVLLAPVYAYLTNDVRSRVQFWLDVQSAGWHERIYQPLTHPYALGRSWDRSRQWTDDDELRTARDMLSRVVRGLAYRCGERIVLASSQLTLSGQEEGGMLSRALQRSG